MKITYTLYHVLFVSFLIVGNTHGQEANTTIQLPEVTLESFQIHTDRQLYVTGEIIWFKLTTSNDAPGQLSGDSKVGYLELIAPDGSIITRVKTELVDGQSSGSILLPKGIASNLYKLRSYTRQMRNFGSDSFTFKEVYILNSDHSLLASNTNNSTPAVASPPEEVVENKIEVNIDISNVKTQQRELVELKLKSIDASGNPTKSNLSISVAIPHQEINNTTHSFQTPTSTFSEITNKHPSETLGMKITGQVLTGHSKPANEGIRVYLSFPGKTAMVYTAITNTDGRFDFLLPPLYGQRQIIIQLDPKLEEGYSIIIDEEFHPSPPVTEVGRFILPDELIPIANRILVNAQIAESYKSFEPQPEYFNKNKFTSLPFYGKADKVYVLDEFTRFPLPEFFYEIVPEVAVYGKYGSNTLGIINDYHINKKELAPLLLVDGVPVFNQDHFLSINNKLIESSEVVRDPYWLNTIIYNGIIHILSTDGDARCFPLPSSAVRTNYLAFLPQRKFNTPDYSESADASLPDFRNTLYWNPQLTTDENGEASVFFYTSDAIGEYEISVEAIDLEGQKGQIIKLIEVVKPVK